MFVKKQNNKVHFIFIVIYNMVSYYYSGKYL